MRSALLATVHSVLETLDSLHDRQRVLAWPRGQ